MKKPLSLRFALCILSFTLLACGPPERHLADRYKQDFRVPVAFLDIEWNGWPHVLASGWLADKEKGVFYTAKHFTNTFEEVGTSRCKIFFNGRVYDGALLKVPPLRDTALIRITSQFDPSDFPEPQTIFDKRPQAGEIIFVQGFHPHPHWLRELNKTDKFPDKLVPILRGYYGMIFRNLDGEREVVFDNLEGTVVKPDPNAMRRNPLLDVDQKRSMLEYENDSYIKVLTARDHRYSFGGLSGGVALNAKGEAAGVITAQDPLRLELDEHGTLRDPNGGIIVASVKKQKFDVMYITPMDSLKDLREYVRTLK